MQWQHYVATGVAREGDTSPPPGSLLFYSGASSAGHVAVYLGEGQAISNDVLDSETGRRGGVHITEAAELTDGAWRLNYLGWAPPTY
ncbi:C40 family peptidase [Aeromicrobium sp. YIM 150415]|uniref:NlpC/P60 family protein n=1 Tax=Aeromicrobium sp. YIM 150415 TaxID=2803912 RepID=UPI0019658A29|nr:NlpC/P60 family protein [Aeromicrobium sp. YIM 150415]MBM9463253.1 C40 family peptidase [Aeromicrobium sp. YIM 150415]